MLNEENKINKEGESVEEEKNSKLTFLINKDEVSNKIKDLYSGVYLTILSVILGGVLGLLSLKGYEHYNKLFASGKEIKEVEIKKEEINKKEIILKKIVKFIYPLISFFMVTNTWLAYSWFFFLFVWPPTLIDRVLPLLLGLTLSFPIFAFNNEILFFSFQTLFCLVAVLGFSHSYSNLAKARYDVKNYREKICCLVKYSYKNVCIENAFLGIILFGALSLILIILSFFENNIKYFFSYILIITTYLIFFILNFRYIFGTVNFWNLLQFYLDFREELCPKFGKFADEEDKETKNIEQRASLIQIIFDKINEKEYNHLKKFKKKNLKKIFYQKIARDAKLIKEFFQLI